MDNKIRKQLELGFLHERWSPSLEQKTPRGSTTVVNTPEEADGGGRKVAAIRMNNLTAETPTLPSPSPVQLPELILSLEQATLMAKQLSTTADPNHLLQIYFSLQQARQHLSSFISQTHFPAFTLLQPPTQATDGENGDEPMQVGDEDDYEATVEENSKAAIDKVEESMKDCFIKNKRAKRSLSPSAAEERRFIDDRDAGRGKDFDPYGTRLRALDLIYQFHG